MEVDCAICYSNAVDAVFCIHCSQCFCKSHLQEWITSQHSCPHCREKIGKISSCLSTQSAERILDKAKSASQTRMIAEMRRIEINQAYQELVGLEIAVSKKAVLTIYNCVKESKENQELLLKKKLVKNLSSSLMRPECKIEIRRMIFDIFSIICTDDKDRLDSLRSIFFAVYVVNLLSDDKKFNEDVLLLLETFIQRLINHGIEVYGPDVMLPVASEKTFCVQMESVFDSMSGYYPSIELIASFAFQFTPSSIKKSHSSKFLRTLLEGISLSPSYTNGRKRMFFIGIRNAFKTISALNIQELDKLLGCFNNPDSVCQTHEVLRLLISVGAHVRGDGKAKEVLRVIHPVFETFTEQVFDDDENVNTTEYGPLFEVCQIMNILCDIVGANESMISHIVDTYPSFGKQSLRVLDVLLEMKDEKNSKEIEAIKLILSLHTNLTKQTMYPGEQGTKAVMLKAMANSPQYIAQKDACVALDVLNECRKFEEWK